MNSKNISHSVSKFLFLINIFLLSYCSNEPSYNVEFYKRAEEYKQKNPNIQVGQDGKRVFTAVGHSGILDSTRATSAPKPSTPNNTTFAEKSPIKGEVLDINPVGDSIGNVYLLGICHNTGDSSIHYGKVIVQLFDSAKKEIASGYGFCDKKQLMKGEKTPVKVLVEKPKKFDSYSANLTSNNLSSTDKELAVIELTNTKLTPGQWKGSFQITGQAKNMGSSAINYATVTGITRNNKKQIISMDTAYLGKKNLAPNATENFQISIYIPNGDIPKTFEVYYDGTVKY